MVLRAVHIPGGVGARSTGTSSNRPAWCGTERDNRYSRSHVVNGALTKTSQKAQREDAHMHTHAGTRTHTQTQE